MSLTSCAMSAIAGMGFCRCGIFSNGCGQNLTCSCGSGMTCNRDGYCYSQACSPQIGFYPCAQQDTYGKCVEDKLVAGCTTGRLNCPCPSPYICKAAVGTWGTCGLPRGTDGACHNVPSIPTSIDTTSKAAMTSFVASNYAPYQPCYFSEHLNLVSGSMVWCVLPISLAVFCWYWHALSCTQCEMPISDMPCTAGICTACVLPARYLNLIT
jgi:hypothetical protein